MHPKQLRFGAEAREALHHGATILARAVATTLGPQGHNVALDQTVGPPLVSPDGVTVARTIELADPFENIGAQLLKEAASKTGDVAGDGTTSSTVIARALIDGGHRLVAAGASPLMLKRGLDRGVRALVARLASQATPVRSRAEIAQVATIAALDPEIGELLATILDKAGRNAVITVEESQGTELTYELVEGMRFEEGFLSPYFVTDSAEQVAKLERPRILITDGTLRAADDLLPLFELLAQSNERNLLVIAGAVEGEALATLVLNKLRGTLDSVAVRAPSFGARRQELLEDIAAITGGAVISEELGRRMDKLMPEDLGRARMVRCDQHSTVVIEGSGAPDVIQARARRITAALEGAGGAQERERLEQRLANLTGGVAVVKVGAPTEVALKERAARVDDAIHAVRAALEEGIVPGGGVAYLNLLPALDDLPTTLEEERMALNLLREALEAPAVQIAENAGAEGHVVVEQIRQRQRAAGNLAVGFDAAAEAYGDLVQLGIVDPAKVVRAALENGVSVAGMILSTDTLIADAPDEAVGGAERSHEPATQAG
jgi:chaperonin GroEL